MDRPSTSTATFGRKALALLFFHVCGFVLVADGLRVMLAGPSSNGLYGQRFSPRIFRSLMQYDGLLAAFAAGASRIAARASAIVDAPAAIVDAWQRSALGIALMPGTTIVDAIQLTLMPGSNR
jgi:hypothetical protein